MNAARRSPADSADSADSTDSAAGGDRGEGGDRAGSTDAVLRALADPQRRQILRLVQGSELPAGQIAGHFEMTQQAVSHHLRVLHRAGLLHERRAGTRRLYALDPHALDSVREVLEDLWPAALVRLKQAVEQAHRQQRTGHRR
jgi:DNA-binding transcriptional ArsR family regulator